MAFSIQLYFDSEFEEKIAALWASLEAAGMPSILHKMGSRPHLSLVILKNCVAHQVADLVEGASREYSCFPVTFSAIALTPGEQQTVFLSPTMNPTLLVIQRTIYTLLKENGDTAEENYQPHHWLPHCSISKELSSTDALRTIGICQNHPIIGAATATEIGFIEFRPRKELKTFRLRNR